MKINSLAREDVFHTLVTSEAGLTEEAARNRLAEFGPNAIQELGKPSLLSKLGRQFTHFLALILWVAAALALISDALHPGEGMLTLGLAIVAVIFINGVFTLAQEHKAERAVEKLKLLLPFRVRVVRGGQEREIPAPEVAPGDLVILSGGDKVPADARLIETQFLMVNNASLTGESEPVPLSAKPCDGELIESSNIAFAGTTVVSGSGKAVVFATGMKTEVGRIAHLTSAVETGLTPLQKEIVRATRIIAFLATAMGLVFFGVGYFAGRTFWENFLFAIGIIVANVPEGLLPTVTLALAMGSQRMARKKALVKNLTAVEALGSVTVICTDKTGTLTQNKMEVSTFWIDGTEFAARDLPLNRAQATYLLRVAVLCNNAKGVDGEYKGDPTEISLLRAAGGMARELRSERLFEIPFDAERKRMTTVNRIEGRTFVFAKGALETLLPLCDRTEQAGEVVPFDPALRERLTEGYHALMDKGLRVLAFAYKEIETFSPADGPERIESQLVLAGLVGLEDQPRPEVPEALHKCHEAGIKVVMLTGDASRTAVAIAKEIGLVHGRPHVIEGHEFAALTDAELRDRLREEEVLFTRMAPKHKMRVVSILMEEGERVAVTGDGVNDAPALKKADIGVAMGLTGTDVAKEAADIILLDDNFATIVNAIEEGRAVYENIRKFTSYILSSNIPEIVPYLVFVLFRVPLPLTILQILAVDLGTDMLPALALGAEKPTPGLMKQPPRDPKVGLLSAPLLGRAYLFLGLIEAVAALYGFFYVLGSGGWNWGEMPAANDPLYMQATTACLTAIIVCQIANVMACRSSRESLFRLGLFSNPFIFVGIAAEVTFQLLIVYHPVGNTIFSTQPLPARVWLLFVPFALFLLGAEEIRKAVARSPWSARAKAPHS